MGKLSPDSGSLSETLGDPGRLWEALRSLSALSEALGGSPDSGRLSGLWEALRISGRLSETLGDSRRLSETTTTHTPSRPERMYGHVETFSLATGQGGSCALVVWVFVGLCYVGLVLRMFWIWVGVMAGCVFWVLLWSVL